MYTLPLDSSDLTQVKNENESNFGASATCAPPPPPFKCAIGGGCGCRKMIQIPGLCYQPSDYLTSTHTRSRNIVLTCAWWGRADVLVVPFSKEWCMPLNRSKYPYAISQSLIRTWPHSLYQSPPFCWSLRLPRRLLRLWTKQASLQVYRLNEKSKTDFIHFCQNLSDPLFVCIQYYRA